ncbi:zeta toxin family protein [Streptomyces salinarius]|uniref:zeta toxin family protein n=1 Tax=Streptomyces salinarius TaxID=2762598 RepID=UPI001648F406|nr:zeta toxin family protein [Streptomyces salinarius]
MSDPSVYFLTEEQLRARFEERVQEFVFGGFQPQEIPALVLLGGQPAAGKSQAMAATVQRYGGTLVPLTGDELRPFHPRYGDLQEEDAQTRETATAQFSGAMVRMSIEHALEHGYGLLLEGVFRDPSMTIGTAERFAAAGRRVEVVALAVREERSRLDALDRFLEGGRWTPPELQDLAYAKVPETVAAAEQNPAVTSILITNRSAADLYSNKRGPDGLWSSAPGAVPALVAERSQPMPAQEAASWLTTYRTVLLEMAVRGETTAKSRPVLRQLTRDAETIAVMASPDPGSALRQQHEAVKPLLHLAVEQPFTATGPLPLPLLPTPPSTPQGRAEIRRRDQLTPVERAAEDEFRTAVTAARHRHQGTASAPLAARRPDPSVARSRSTTTSRRPASSPAAPGPSTAPRPGGSTEHRPGRSK